MKKSRIVAVIVALISVLITVTIVSAFSYQIQWGDTLWGISRQFGTTVDTLVQVNNIPNPNLIFAGQYLQIPDGTVTAVSPTIIPPTVPPGTTTYVVQSGDTLSAIARRFGTTVNAIVQANNLPNPNLIFPGQVLIIPVGSGTPVPTATPGPSPTPGPTSTPPPTNFALGGQTLNLAYAANMQYAGMTWAKFQYKWTVGDSPDALASMINAAHNQGFKVLVSVAGATNYPGPGGINFASLVEFLRGVALLGPDAIEVWNEQNIDFEWPAGEISPVSYVNNLLSPAYQAIKQANPNVMVISGALAPTGFDNGYNAWADNRYLAGMWQAGAANYLDCIGAHHNSGATSPTVTVGHPGGTHYSWYFLPTLNLYHNTFAGTRQVCFTELGYLSAEGFPGLPPNFSWAANTTVANQAQWLAEAVTLSRTGGKVRLLVVYNVDYTEFDMSGDPQGGYAIIRPDTTCPACDSLHSVMGGGG